MRRLLLALLLLAALAPPRFARAQEPPVSPAEPLPLKKQPREPKLLTDHTAYTIEKRQWRVGLLNLQYGISERFSLGTNPLAWLLAPNLNGKFIALRREKIDLALQAGLARVDLERIIPVEGATLGLLPLGWKLSWVISDRFSLHAGTSHLVAKVSGGLTGEQLGAALGVSTGQDVGGSLGESGVDTEVYSSAQATLHQLNLAFDWRLNRRDTIILESRNAFALNGRFEVGAEASHEESGASTSTSVVQTINTPLKEVPSSLSLAWQWSWEHFHLRLGIPLNPVNPYSWSQAFTAYWLIGPRERG